jgi:hypothetical protein
MADRKKLTQKQKDEAGQYGGVFGSKNKAVREHASRKLMERLKLEAPSPKFAKMSSLIKSAKKFGASDEEINAANTIKKLENLVRQYGAMSTERTGRSTLIPLPPKKPTRKEQKEARKPKEPKLGHGGMAMKKPEMMKGGMYKGKKHMYAAGGVVKEIKM